MQTKLPLSLEQLMEIRRQGRQLQAIAIREAASAVAAAAADTLADLSGQRARPNA